MASPTRLQRWPHPVAARRRAGHLSLVTRQFDYWVTVYRRTWRGSVVYSFLTPVLLLAALGGVLGGYVDAARPDLAPARSYLEFVATGLLAGQMAQIAVQEVLWPVMARITWNKTYHAMIATPLTVPDVVLAHLLYVLFRLATTAAVFMAVLAVVGVFRSPWWALAVFGVQLLVGWVFAALFYIIGARSRSDSAFSVVYRAVFLPVFFFSGAFFPVANLAPALQAAAKATPLWHGVELTRMLAAGVPSAGMLAVHLGYLVLVGVLGTVAAVRSLRHRIVS